MSFISYSQNFEDVMLWRALKGVQDGFYIDIGAHEPTNGSVTKAFYDCGWSGINIEPIAEPFELLKAARLRDINLQVCAGAENGEINIYDIIPTGLATVQLNIAEKYRAAGNSVEVKRMPVQTLSSICKKYVTGEIHFLKIDVEGFEKEVLLGADFSIFQPWIIVVEATCPNSPELNYASWEDIVLDAGYKFAYFDGLNRFYVSANHEELLSHFTTPPNYFDDFALSSSCFFSRKVTAELQQAKAKTQQAEAKTLQAKAKTLQAEAKSQQADAKSQQAEAKIQQLHTELHSVYISRSWRITAPLRWFSNQARFLKQHGFIARTKAFTKKITRHIVLRAIAFINSRSGLRRQFVKLSRRLGLYNFARTLYLRYSRLTYQTQSKSNNLIAAEIVRNKHASPHARRIFTDLEVAISKAHDHKMNN